MTVPGPDATPQTTPSPAAALPTAGPGETKGATRFFESNFFKRVNVGELLTLASTARGEDHICHFGSRAVGVFNVVLFIKFDDGVEWVAKLPRVTLDDKDNEYLKSECATMMFVHELGTIPIPKVFAYCFTPKNPANSPYLFMEKVSGCPLVAAVKRGLTEEGWRRTLSQLAQIKKTLFKYPRTESGSFTMYVVQGKTRRTIDRQYTIWTVEEDCRTFRKIHRRLGPYYTSLHYYSTLLNIGWSEWMEKGFTYNNRFEGLQDRFKVHYYLTSVLPSYVKDTVDQFFLAHSDLHEGNIFVDENGNITGLIDWEFSSVLPKQASEHYPLFLADDNEFIAMAKDVYENPLAELEKWRDFYAKQFDDDPEMSDYFANVKSIIAFERVLRAPQEATVDNLVNKFKLIESADALDNIGRPLIWTNPRSPEIVEEPVNGPTEEPENKSPVNFPPRCNEKKVGIS
jgi:Phosphotransferase enzyme family